MQIPLGCNVQLVVHVKRGYYYNDVRVSTVYDWANKIKLNLKQE